MAISVLAPAKTYISIAFYRLWFGIILFGMANGFFLIPVILSFLGPTATVVDPSLQHEEELENDVDYDLQSAKSSELLSCSCDSPGNFTDRSSSELDVPSFLKSVEEESESANSSMICDEFANEI